MILTVSADAHELFDRIGGYLSPEDVARVESAFQFASDKHAGQTRKSGEPYVTHPATVAFYLAQYHLDTSALIAALLHDVAEDTPASIPEIEAHFGADVAQIVDGVTKFKRSTSSAKEAHDQTVSKLFRYMTRDVRVVIIKIFDRLHNMRTIGSMPQHKKERIARETLDIYAKLANRLGMWQIKNELERISFQIIDPETYWMIKGQLLSRINAHDAMVDQACARISRQLEQSGLDISRVCASPRNAYTIFKKHRGNDCAIEVDHYPRLLVVVKDKIACYTALGLIHELWRPVPGEFDDYVAQPRDNHYRALHTTVRHESGDLIKIRLRTEAMAVTSEIGVLGRWFRSDIDMSPQMASDMAEQVEALIKSIEHNISDTDTATSTAVQNVLGDVLSDQITGYTPKGDPIELPKGATALDFAYKIHTAVGANAYRASVNGDIKPLNTVVYDGDTVSILRQTKSTPKHHWLDEDLGFLHTGSARSVVRRTFRRLPERIAVRKGRALLDDEMAMIGQQFVGHDLIAEWMGYADTAALYAALGRADELVTDVARRVLSRAWHRGREKTIGRKVTATHEADPEQNESFVILGAADVHEVLHLCGNCNPRPGSQIRGYIRKNQRITVHRLDCHLLPSLAEAAKLLELRWGQESRGAVREALIEIEIYDRPNLLYEITDMLRDEHINISWINTPRNEESMRVDLCLDVESPRQLVILLHQFKSLMNVRSVRHRPPEHDG